MTSPCTLGFCFRRVSVVPVTIVLGLLASCTADTRQDGSVRESENSTNRGASGKEARNTLVHKMDREGVQRIGFVCGRIAGTIDGWTQESSRRVEEELDFWVSPCVEPYMPPLAWIDPTIDVTGSWVIRGDDDRSTLDIRAGGGLFCDVELFTCGHVDHWRLVRVGMYSGGELRFDRPVREYLPLAYDRLYAVRLPNGEERLLVALCPDEMARLCDGGLAPESQWAQYVLMYRRAAPESSAGESRGRHSGS